MKAKSKNNDDPDLVDQLMRIIDLQSRVIEAMAQAIGAMPEPKDKEETE